MTPPNNTDTILERIATGNHTESDLKILLERITSGNNQNVVQVGKYAVNLGSAQNIHIGDRIYQGVEAETLKEVLRTLQRERLVGDSGKVPFQIKVLASWLILSFISTISLILALIFSNLDPASQVQAVIFKNFIGGFFYFSIILFMAYSIYGILGIFIEGVSQHNWEFSEVKHSYIVWFFYPIISAVRVVFLLLQFIAKFILNYV